MSTIRPSECVVCGTPITQARKGPARTTCSTQCRTALHRMRHPEVVILYIGPGIGDHLTAGPVPRGDLHSVALDQIEGTLRRVADLWLAGEPPERQAETRDRIVSALRPLIQRVERYGASQRDALDVNRFLNPVLADLQREAVQGPS